MESLIIMGGGSAVMIVIASFVVHFIAKATAAKAI